METILPKTLEFNDVCRQDGLVRFAMYLVRCCHCCAAHDTRVGLDYAGSQLLPAAETLVCP